MKWLAYALLWIGCTARPAVGHAQEFASGQPWGLEFGLGWGRAPESAYTRTLEDFGYVLRGADDLFDGRNSVGNGRRDFRASLAVDRVIVRYFDILLQANSMDRREYERSAGVGEDDNFTYNTWGIGVHGRAWLPTPNGRVRGYIQAGIGPTITVTRLTTRLEQDGPQVEFKDTQWYYFVAGLAGIEGMIAKHVGMFVQGGYIYAPTPVNRFDERAESGGGLVLAGLSFRFGGDG